MEEIERLYLCKWSIIKKDLSYKNLDESNLIILKEKIKNQKNRKAMLKDIEKRLNPKKRKQTDYQWSELIVSLCLLENIDVEKITFEYIKDIFYLNINEKLLCKKEILDKYLEDLSNSFDLEKIKTYIKNFKINISIEDINKVYLTGKSYKDYPEIVDLNKEYKDKKPNSDVYFKLKETDEIRGISCKQSKGCPCTNKVVELNNTELCILREKLLNENGITIENYREKRGQSGEINKILSNTYCTSGILQEYWKKLIDHILENKQNHFIPEVINSMCQGSMLSYTVYEYDGEELIDTKNRCLEKEKCDIRNSEIFCWGKNGPRKASKIWFDLLYDNEVLYCLEVRFKGTYFGKGGQPQLFIYKESKEDIQSYIETRENYLTSQ